MGRFGCAWSGGCPAVLTGVTGRISYSAVLEGERTRSDAAARLADQIVGAYAAGAPYLTVLAQLCALCEDAGLDHAAILNDAARRAEQAAWSNRRRPVPA